MILPLPTVSNIDVTAERLRDVDRDAARPLPDIAGTAMKAIQTGAAVQEMGEQERRRQEADWFQKEYVDKGWEGADKMWKEMGSPSDMNPAYWRTAVGDAPAKYFEALGKKMEEKKESTLANEYASTIEAEDPETAFLVRSRMIDGKTAYTQRQTTGRAEAAAKSRADLAEAKRKFDSIEKALDRAAAMARTKVGRAGGANVGAVEKFRKEMESLRRQADEMDASGDRFVNPSKYTDFLTRARDYERRVNEILAKVPEADESAASGSGGTDKRGAYNPATGKIEYN